MGNLDLSIRILGCGTSGGVPRVGGPDGQGHWGKCNPNNPKNRRGRCSVLLQRHGRAGTTNVLVDASPDVRQQLLDAQVGLLDALVFTHEHADHTHGIDDLRVVVGNKRERLKTYMDKRTSDILLSRFDYCFIQPEGSLYSPILEPHLVSAGKDTQIDGEGGPIAVLPFEVEHGRIMSLGLRVADAVYLPDVSHIPEPAYAFLEGLDLLIIDGFRHAPAHATHFVVSDALRVIDRVAPKRAVITNLHTDLDYDELAAFLPAGVEPAYDGLTITVPAESSQTGEITNAA